MKKSISILLALITLLVTCLSAMAEVDPANIDTSQTGNLHIVKYEYSGDAATTGTGLASQTIPTGATVLGDVEFTVYKLGELSSYFTPTGIALPTPTEAEGLIAEIEGTVKTTNASGVADFTGLPLGVYYVKETNAPAWVTTRSLPFVVTLPWTNASGDAWVYDVYVYPKNGTTYGDVTIIKTGKDNARLANATFKLERWDPTLDTPAWTNLSNALTTGSDGTVTAAGLYSNTNYRLIETAAPTGYVVDATKAYYFKIDNDGKIAACDLSPMPTDYPAASNQTLNAGETNTITITNPPQTVDKVISGGGKTTTGSVGDDVSFDITTTAPPSIESLEYFYLVDTLSAGLTYKSVSVAGMTAGTEYTVTQSGQEVKINFDATKLTGGQAITVTLVATINQSAVVGTSGNPNEVDLFYDHDTSTGDSPEDPDAPPPVEPEDPPKVYVAQVILNKVDPEGNALSGATFLLQKQNGTAWTDVETISTGSTFTFKQLGAGSYRLIEKKAPTVDGRAYNLLKDPIEFTLTFNETDKTFTNSNSGFTVGSDGGTFTIQVKNSRGFDLPKTGGMGTILYTVGGVALIGIALFLFFKPRKKKGKAH